MYAAPACYEDLHFSPGFLAVCHISPRHQVISRANCCDLKQPWKGQAEYAWNNIFLKKSNPVFSANGMNHFQATGKQGDRMAIAMFHSDCQWMEEGKKRGMKREKDELEENERGKV